MKKIALALMLSVICAAPSLVSAATKPYVSISGGLGLMNDSKWTHGGELAEKDEFKTGVALEGAVGVKMDMFRVEAATGYQSNEADNILYVVNDDTADFYAGLIKMSAAIRSYMVNAYADFDMNNGIAPFVMAGVGLANVDMKYRWENDNGASWSWDEALYSQDVFAWQVGAGVGMRAADNLTIDLSYRYFATSDVTVGANIDYGDLKYAVGTSKILLGMRYIF